MHTLLEQIRAQIGNVKEYVNKGHHHRAIVTELEKVEKRFSEYEEVASLASLAPAAESEGDRVCHDDDGCPTENAVLRREWRKLTAQVAALTAQCEGLKVSRDAYKRDAEGLLQISRAAADALERTEKQCEGLRKDAQKLKSLVRDMAPSFRYVFGRRGQLDCNPRDLELIEKRLSAAIAAGNGEGV